MTEKEIQISQFESKFAKDFARLNYEWIEEYFTIEAHDRKMLDNPEEYIIDRGGRIFFASKGDKIVGTVALIAVGEVSFELAKMAVARNCRGEKIGEKLMSACVELSANIGKKSIILLSNTKLVPAINLYKKFGFKEIPLDPNTPYERTDIQMELILEK